MDSAEVLRRAGAELLAETEAYCDRAAEVFDLLEAWGREPVAEDIGDLFADEPYYFTPPAVLPAPERLQLPRKQRSHRGAVSSADVCADVSEALGVAHTESPGQWQTAIEQAMRGRSEAVPFGVLLEATGLSPGALFLGLLLGEWQLRQDDFYGEIYATRE